MGEIDYVFVWRSDKCGPKSKLKTFCCEANKILRHIKSSDFIPPTATGGEADDRGWDGWMASPTQWTWVWVNSRSRWWTGKPVVLQSTGSQSVGHDGVAEKQQQPARSHPWCWTHDDAQEWKEKSKDLYWRGCYLDSLISEPSADNHPNSTSNFKWHKSGLRLLRDYPQS